MVNAMEFLPQDYEAPKTTTSYLKLQDGENKFRILSSPILGWEDWKVDGDKKLPVRFRMNMKPDKPLNPETHIRHFWAMIVWNCAQSKIQIFEITQSSIMNRITELAKDSDWGSPFTYDIKIVKSGAKKDTKYAVTPSPKKDLDQNIKDEFYKTPVDLEELFRGGDPFQTHADYRTKAFWEQVQLKSAAIVDDFVTAEQCRTIEDAIERFIAPSDRYWADAAFKAFKISSFDKLPRRHYDLMMKRIDEKKKMIETEEIPF